MIQACIKELKNNAHVAAKLEVFFHFYDILRIIVVVIVQSS